MSQSWACETFAAMNPESSREVSIFTEVLSLPLKDRRAYLDGACACDENLRSKIEVLLQAHSRAEGFLERPAGTIAPEMAAQRPTNEKAGDHIGRYKLLRQIGEGGCGVVYLAEQAEPVYRQVALKVIKPGMDSKSVITRFQAERQALALMDHPNVAKLFDAGTTEAGRPFFIMEMIQGIKITDYCDRRGLTIRERLRLLVQVCQGVQHAHQKGVIHRDIKPSNILVTTTSDGTPLPVIIDFGIAKPATHQLLTDQTFFTVFDLLVGTPAYMSPEQAALTSVDVDTRTDIYSLGVLLYELLTGVTPFDTRQLIKSGLSEMLRVIREEEPPRLSTKLRRMPAPEIKDVAQRRESEPVKLIRDLRGDLDCIAMKALAKDRVQRYATANGLAMDVQRYLAGEPISARSPSALYKFRKTVARNKPLFAGTGIVVTLLVFFLLMEHRAHRKAEIEAAKNQQVTRFLEEMLQGVGPSAALGKDTTILREILDKTSTQIGSGMTDQPAVEAEVRSVMGMVYREIGVNDRAENMDRSALAIYQKLAGANSREAAAVLDELGLALISQGKPSEAEGAERQSLEIRRRLFGNENAEVATSLHDLAHAEMDAGKWSEAEALTRESLAIRQKLFGDDSLPVADSLRNLGILQGDQGNWADAEATEWKVLAIRQKYLGPEHPWVASTLADIAWVEGGRGKLDEAAALDRQALVMREKLLSPDHPDTAKSLYLLGERERQRGNFPEASSLLTDARAAQLKLGIQGTPTYLDTLRSLGLILEAQGKFVEAEDLRREIQATWLKLGRSDTPRALTDLGDLIQVIMAQGKMTEAQQLFARVALSAVTNMPSSASLLILGASLNARESRWQEAAGDALQAYKYCPSDAGLYPELAALLVKTGNSAKYQLLCKTLITTGSNTVNFFVPDAIAKSCLFGPSAGVDLDAVNRLEDEALARGIGDTGALPYLQDCKALCEYRMGNFAEAVEWAEKPLKAPVIYVHPHSYATLAMADWQLGRKTEARAMLDKGNALAPAIMPEEVVRENGSDWLAWLYARVQLDEAAALIKKESMADSNVAKP